MTEGVIFLAELHTFSIGLDHLHGLKLNISKMCSVPLTSSHEPPTVIQLLVYITSEFCTYGSKFKDIFTTAFIETGGSILHFFMLIVLLNSLQIFPCQNLRKSLLFLSLFIF